LPCRRRAPGRTPASDRASFTRRPPARVAGATLRFPSPGPWPGMAFSPPILAESGPARTVSWRTESPFRPAIPTQRPDAVPWEEGQELRRGTSPHPFATPVYRRHTAYRTGGKDLSPPTGRIRNQLAGPSGLNRAVPRCTGSGRLRERNLNRGNSRPGALGGEAPRGSGPRVCAMGAAQAPEPASGSPAEDLLRGPAVVPTVQWICGLASG